MFFRFAFAVVLVVLVALSGAAIETYSLELRRRVAQQQYQLDVLAERHTRLRLEAQQLGAPTRWLDPLQQGALPLRQPKQPVRAERRATPLMNWTQSPLLPEPPPDEVPRP